MWKNTRSRRDRAYLNRLQGPGDAPVFVLGEHRSGTTILYKLLSLSGSFTFLTAYHVLYYGQILANHEEGLTEKARGELNAVLRDLGLKTRLVDEIELTADYPEEYCFILQAHARGFRLGRRTFPVFDEMCRKLRYTGVPGRRLLLKNPFDFDNFLAIREMVPGARFIFIHRHPLDTLSSMLRMVRRNWREGNVYHQLHSRPYTLLQRNPVSSGLMGLLLGERSPAKSMMARRIEERARYYRENVARLPEGDRLSLRYEDLCREPAEQMERIFSFLGETPGQAVEYEKLIRPRGLSLLPDLQRIEDSLRRRFGETIAWHGYDREGKERG